MTLDNRLKRWLGVTIRLQHICHIYKMNIDCKRSSVEVNVVFLVTYISNGCFFLSFLSFIWFHFIRFFLYWATNHLKRSPLSITYIWWNMHKRIRKKEKRSTNKNQAKISTIGLRQLRVHIALVVDCIFQDVYSKKINGQCMYAIVYACLICLMMKL